jgi:quinol monooxygenase YgiN
MIHVIADIEVTAGRRDEFLAAFKQLVPEVLAEEGCLEYGPTVDVSAGLDAQPAVRENVVTVVERWESVAALQAHLAAAHMKSFRERCADLMQRVTIRVTQPA